MASTTFMRVVEVAKELGVFKSYAYKIVQKLNAELKSQGFITISGRVIKQYFLERACYCYGTKCRAEESNPPVDYVDTPLYTRGA